MKKMQWMGITAMAILLSTGFSACSEESEPVVPGQELEQEYVTVGFGIAGEYLELSESPLATRTEESELKDLIGIEVSVVTESGSTGYAYGVFTSLEDVSIKLLKGQKYLFSTSIIVDGYGCPEHLGHKEYHTDNTCYGFDKDLTGKDFIYGTKGDLMNFDRIQTNSKKDSYKHDRFYGTLSNYTPTEEGTVTIATHQASYGAHYIAEGLTEGSLTVDVGGLYTIELSSEYPETDGIYPFSSIASACGQMYNEKGELVDYYKTKQLTFNWTKTDGSVKPLGTYDVTFKRNVKTTIRIKVSETDPQNKIVITREDTSWNNDENEYVIADGEMTEVPVTEA